MKEIRGDAKSIRQLLSGAKYSIDYYQREYKWETKHVSELINDLTDKFKDDYEENHERTDVEDYGHYFLGSIIISNKNGQKFIIDGQQRLTTITLFLIFLYNEIDDSEDKSLIAPLIYSKKHGKKSFNLSVEERTVCMEALYNNEPFDESDKPEAIRNIVGRYNDIKDLFPEELMGEVISYFIDWFIDNVYLVEITAYSDDDAYLIFETMNDRGLSLSPTDMLKGYLLANITDNDKKISASKIWKKRIAELISFGKDEDSDSIKSWLRSQYANSIRERKRGAIPQDFDRIGAEFHRWIRDNKDSLRLNRSNDFYQFIAEDMDFYSRQYLKLRVASSELTPGLEVVFYNAQYNFTLQYPVLLAAVEPSDSEEDINRKIRIVGSYLDVLIARRVWNWRAIGYSTMQYAMFLIMKEIRSKSIEEVVSILTAKLDDEKETFASNDRFYLHGQNGRQIHQILARLTDYVETQSGMPSRYAEYIVRSGRNGYEIEHIWADHPERHADEFNHPNDFSEYRNRIGGLLLLPKKFNASYGDLPYEEKLDHYFGQNLLAKSLHSKCYQRNPGFIKYIDESTLPFKSYAEFKRVDLDERQNLYKKIAEEIWNPERLEREAKS